MPRRAARKDSNQDDIVDAFQKLGYFVALTFQLGDGFPDLVISGSNLGTRNVLIEVKSEGGELTPKEKEFWAWWPGEKEIVNSVEAAYSLHESWGPFFPPPPDASAQHSNAAA